MSTSDATTSVPAASLADAGFIAPTEQDILAGVQADINAALGGDVNPDLTTPQGQLAQSETAIIGDCNDQLLALFNGFDPRNASGRMQDAIGYLFLMTRHSNETRIAFEARREDTIEANSNGTNAAIMGALLSLSDVTDAYVVDNPTDDAVTTGGVSIAGRSLFICVAGGASSEIGLVILQRKNPCSQTVGSTSVTVTDPNTVYGGNGPSYTFNYTQAAETAVYVAVSITNASTVPSTALTSIQAAVLAAFNGTDGGTRARIGATLYASRYYAGIAALGTWAQIVEITIGTAANPTGFTTVMSIAEVPTLSADNITLTLV